MIGEDTEKWSITQNLYYYEASFGDIQSLELDFKMEMRTHQYCSNGNRGKCSHGSRQSSFYNDLLPRSLPAINTSTDFCST